MSNKEQKERQKEKNFHYHEVDVYHDVQVLIATYSHYSEVVNKNHVLVNQDLFHSLNLLARAVFFAANTQKNEIDKKLDYLEEAQMQIKSIYCTAQSLSSARSLSLKAFESFSKKLFDIYEKIEKWQRTLYLAMM